MLTAIDEKAFQQFTQKFFKKILRKPSHNKLVFSRIHAELFDPISITLLLS